ncbi:hypothetical protein EON63_02125 [archaeon]|nr:MAG: hypothetical protein EON63_02125 [archaeon]
MNVSTLPQCPRTRPSKKHRAHVKAADAMLYIFTSGMYGEYLVWYYGHVKTHNIHALYKLYIHHTTQYVYVPLMVKSFIAVINIACQYQHIYLHILPIPGTTGGAPKAAKLSHYRYFMAAQFFPALARMRRDDVLYSPLPLYHTAAGVLGLGAAIGAGMIN